MLTSRNIDRDTATVPWFAAQDARMRSEIAKTHFTVAEHRKADAMRFALQLFYRADKDYVTWRDGGKSKRPQFAAIKFEYPTVRNRKDLSKYENELETDKMLKKIDKVVTKQGITYRVYFK